jgi:hypothetical protein
MMKNKYNLSRHIKAEIIDQIKKNSFYGCVICGNGFCELEHIYPEFKDSLEHDPDKMCLLCRDCHGQVSGKSASKNKVEKARRNPFLKNNPVRRKLIQFDNSIGINVELGSNSCINCKYIFVVNNLSYLAIKKTSNQFQPFIVECKIYDSNNNLIFEIQKNMLIVHDKDLNKCNLSQNTIEIEIKDKFNISIDLKINKLQTEQDNDVFKITKFRYIYKNNELKFTSSKTLVLLPINAQFSNNQVTNVLTAFQFNTDSIITGSSHLPELINTII